MSVMLERWNDDKMDALDAKVGGLEVKVDVLGVRVDALGRRVNDLDRRMEKGFERVDTELREQRREMKAGFDGMHRLMVQGAIGLSAAYIAGFAALIGLIATQL